MTSWLEWLLKCDRDQRGSTAQSGVEKTLQIVPTIIYSNSVWFMD